MDHVTRVKQLLSELVKSDASPLYTLCQQITVYVEHHPAQINITIGGLRAALRRPPDDDELLIRAAFTLSFHPFQALQVRYRLYDRGLNEVIQEMEHAEYMTALSRSEFVDDEGNEIAIGELHRRTFPYFINQLRPATLQSGWRSD